MKIGLSLAAGAAMAASMLISPSELVAQPGGRGGFGGAMGGNNPMFLLMNEKVREELEIVDDQFSELQEMQEEFGAEMRDMFSGMRGGGGERPNWEEMRAKMEEKTKEFQKRVDSILLPHQQTRLKQLFIQSQSRGRPGGALFSNDDLKDQLNITEDQEDKMREMAEKANKELQEKVAKLREEAEAKILSVLTKEQQDKYKELVGDSFDFGEMGRPQMGGRGGQQGGGRGNRSDF